MVWFRADPAATDPRIVIVQLDEKDIESMDWPLRDKTLSALLEKIESGAPVTIGLDLYRDLPEPRDGSGTATLNQTFLQHQEIVPIFLFGDEKTPFTISPPEGSPLGPERGSQPLRLQ